LRGKMVLRDNGIDFSISIIDDIIVISKTNTLLDYTDELVIPVNIFRELAKFVRNEGLV